jgi:UDP-GlcNAc:undecaprenyl-phosphate GlcNAc-1-phosphate transferase
MCLIPLFDTIAAIIRRWKLGVSFFTADRFHVHHKLLNLGLNTRQSLAVIYVFALISGACVLPVAYLGYTASWFIMLGAWIIVFAFFMVMHYVKENKIQIGYRSIDKPNFNKEPEE